MLLNLIKILDFVYLLGENLLKMKLLLEIKDGKAQHLWEVLKSIPYVKATIISDEKARLLKEMKEAVSEVNQIKTGKLKARSAREILDEL